MKKFWTQIVILMIIIVVAMLSTFNKDFLSTFLNLSSNNQTQFSTAQVKIGGVLVNAEIADNKDTREKGLGGRDSLSADSGMMFVFSDVSKHTFWMKGMRFGLDFIWIRNDQVVDLLKNVPPPSPNQPDSSLPILQPSTDINKVLEVNGGFIDAHNIKIGDNVVITQL